MRLSTACQRARGVPRHPAPQPSPQSRLPVAPAVDVTATAVPGSAALSEPRVPGLLLVAMSLQETP